MAKFKFTYMGMTQIEAADVTEAVQKFRMQHPGILSIKEIWHNGREMGCVTGKTRADIYYEPGCSCGMADCINDPMRKAAKSCTRQCDMIPGKWESCQEPDPYDDNCYNYVRK